MTQRKSNIGIVVSKGENRVRESCSAMILASVYRTLASVSISAHVARSLIFQ